jgi:regulator of sirC expression with transglutaminase-like and TPR domain
VLLDPFDGGTVVTPERAADLVTRVFGPGAELVPSYLAPVGRHHILTRMLLNLRTAYCQREKWDRALAVVERLMVVDPDTPSHRRDRGTMLMKLGYVHHGAAEWEEYLTNHPEAEDAEFLRDQLRRVRRYLAARS